MMHQILRPVRSGVARLLPTGTNSAVDCNGQVQNVFAPKDSGLLDIQPSDVPASQHALSGSDGCSNDRASSFPVATSDSDFPASQSVPSQFAPATFPWGINGHASSLSHSSFLAQQDLRFGGVALARSICNGQLSAGYGQESPPECVELLQHQQQPMAELGAMPLIAGTVWMPVLWPVFRSFGSEMTIQDASVDPGIYTTEQHQGEAMVGVAECGAPLQSAPVQQACQVDASHAAREAQVTGQGRRQRRSRKAVAADRKANEEALTSSEIGELRLAVQEKERDLLARPDSLEASPDTAVPNTEVSSAKAPKPATQLNRADSNSSSTSVSLSSSRISNWADAVDSEDEVGGLTLNGSTQTEYDVDHMLLELDCNDKARQQEALHGIIGSVWPLAMSRSGCRVVQRALEVAPAADQHLIAEKLQGHVLESMKSPNANHVLQKCIEIMPPEKVQFILQELNGHGAFAARHRFGCRILQRLIEHCPPLQTESLVTEVLADASKLARHQYGNFVIQHILQHGSPDQLHQIAQVLRADLIRFAKHRVASHVVSCAMVHCSPEDVQSLTQVVLGEAGQLADLTRRQYGSFVVREVHRAARLHGQTRPEA